MINESYRTAYIYVCNRFAGALKETDGGYSFTYNANYLNSENPTAVSLTLPLQTEEYTSKTLVLSMASCFKVSSEISNSGKEVVPKKFLIHFLCH